MILVISKISRLILRSELLRGLWRRKWSFYGTKISDMRLLDPLNFDLTPVRSLRRFRGTSKWCQLKHRNNHPATRGINLKRRRKPTVRGLQIQICKFGVDLVVCHLRKSDVTCLILPSTPPSGSNQVWGKIHPRNKRGKRNHLQEAC